MLEFNAKEVYIHWWLNHYYNKNVFYFQFDLRYIFIQVSFRINPLKEDENIFHINSMLVLSMSHEG